MSRQVQFTREDAFDARPLAAKIFECHELPDGGARIVIGCKATRMQRFLLRLPEIVKREFELDAYGMEILGMCDGQKSVRHLVKKFARTHNLNPQEAQQAIVTFLQSMIRKGLVVMVVPNGGSKA